MCKQRKLMVVMILAVVMMVMGNTFLSLQSSTKMIKEETKEDGKENAVKVGVLKKRVPKNFGVDEMEEYSPSSVNMTEVEEEMRRRRRRVKERCGDLAEEERMKEINRIEFLINKRYKLIWCNTCQTASLTWMYKNIRMTARLQKQIQSLQIPPEEVARLLYPRPSHAQLRGYLRNSSGNEDAGKGYLSFIIVREPFQRLLSAYRNKIEKIIPYYRPLRCKITQETSNIWNPLGQSHTCTPTFPEFVDYVIKTEQQGGAHDEHWAPYYRFCTPCSAHFDLILRFESLRRDEAYLLEKVPGLSEVVSPMVMHSSHSNYSSILAQYFRELTRRQMLDLIEIYMPDFHLFGYNESPYLALVL